MQIGVGEIDGADLKIGTLVPNYYKGFSGCFSTEMLFFDLFHRIELLEDARDLLD